MAFARPNLEDTRAGVDALQTSIKNRFNRYGFSKDDHATAGWRLSQHTPVDVQFTPKFELTAQDKIFTMGSCFARNVEKSMIEAGVPVLLKDFDFPEELLHPMHARLVAGVKTENRDWWIRTVLNKYTTHSMLNEFERIFLPEKFADPFRGLIQNGAFWNDPQVNNLRNMTLDEALMARDTLESAAALVVYSSAVFLTLGMTETWYDAETKVFLTSAPPPLLIRRYPQRFRFFNATHSDTLRALEEIYALLCTKVRADIKIVVTVSPVPLGTTFTTTDILAANAYSKATLRSAAGEFASRHANVDYFPSYEMVLLSRPELVWEPDYVHIQQTLVDSVVGRFVDGYVERPAKTVAAG